MRASRLLLLLAAGVALAPPLGAQNADEAAALQRLRDCVVAAPTQLKPGLEALRTYCPRLSEDLAQLKLTPQLDDGWTLHITPTALGDLVALQDRYQSAPNVAVPDLNSLQQIERTLHGQQRPPQTWWQRFKEWFFSWLRLSNAPKRSWLDQLLAHLSLPLLAQTLLFYGVTALLVGAAIWLVWRELKLANAGRRGRVGASAAKTIVATPAPSLSLADLESAAVWEQPALLLRLLVEALMQSGRLRSERALTHRELAHRAVFDDDAQHTRFADIALQAEWQLYGPKAAMERAEQRSRIERLMAEGKQLYARLQIAPQSAR